MDFVITFGKCVFSWVIYYEALYTIAYPFL